MASPGHWCCLTLIVLALKCNGASDPNNGTSDPNNGARDPSDPSTDESNITDHGVAPQDLHNLSYVLTPGFYRPHSTPSYMEHENSTSLWEDSSDSGGNTTKKRRRGHPCGVEEGRYRKNLNVHLKLICVPFLTVVGITGNALSFIVMGSPVYRRKSYSYYLRALAVFDSLTLLTEATVMGNDISIHMGPGAFLRDHSAFTCKLTNFLENVVYVMSSWLVVAFTLDRYIAVCHPLQRARLCTETRAKVLIGVLLVVAIASQSFRFYYISYLEHRERPCHAQAELRMEYFGIHYLWFSFCLRFALPFLFIVVCNGLIIFHVQRMQKIRQTEERDKKRRAHMAITTLVVICAVFVLTLVPNAVIAIVQYFKGRDIATFCVLHKIDTPLQMVRLLNYSTNFILYGLSGRLFRSELRRLLTCRRPSSASSASKKVAITVNFKAMQRRLPALGAANGAAPCRRVAGGCSIERRLFLGPNGVDRENESEL